MLGCSLNLFMMLSMWSSFFYFANARVFLYLFMMLSIWPSIFYSANARVFLEFIHDVGYMVLFLLVCECSGVPWIYFWCWVYGPHSFILQMLASSLNLFMMLNIWSSFFYFSNARMFLVFIYDVENMDLFHLFRKC